MMRLVVSDARKRNIDFKIDLDYLFQCFYEDEVCFREVRTPMLVHWDLWEGNIIGTIVRVMIDRPLGVIVRSKKNCIIL